MGHKIQFGVPAPDIVISGSCIGGNIVMNIVFTAFKPSAPPRVPPKAAIP